MGEKVARQRHELGALGDWSEEDAVTLHISDRRPSYPVELLADLHADNLPPDQSERLWPLVRNDSDAVDVLRALDRVTDELRTIGRDDGAELPIPADVADLLERALGSDSVAPAGATVHQLHAAPAAPVVEPPTPTDRELYQPLDEWHPADRRTRRRFTVAAASVAGVAAVAAIAFTAVGLSRSQSDSPAVAQPLPPVASASDPTVVDLGTELPARTLLGLIGRHRTDGPLSSRDSMSTCLAANGIDTARPLLGSAPVRFAGRDAVLVLLPGPRPPGVTAVVVGTGCSAADPQLLARSDIG